MKTTWKKYLACMMVIVMMAGLLAGCGNGSADTGDEAEGEGALGYPVTLYYVNADYLETGDETIEPLVMKEGEISAEEENDEVRCMDALALLVEIQEEGVDTMVRPDMIEGVTLTEDGLATVDFRSEEMHGGSIEEVYLIEQVVRTLIKSFDDVDRIRFTVDGSEVESLMGHLEANCTYGLITVEENGTDVELVSILNEK